MAIYNNPNLYSKMKLQQGARGEKFDGNRINRTNYTLNTAPHSATNSKYGMDDRLAVEFKHGYAAGYNQMLITKGRVVAIDPYLEVFDAETQKMDNALTLANGGKDVTFNQDTGHWEEKGTFTLNPETGKDQTSPETVRPANVPIGILMRNEYTRDLDAFNGIIPGAVNTDCMTELPLFASGEKALLNPWGSAYGALKPGDLVKSDATGRMTLSKLSDSNWLATATVADYEAERQQVIGQVYEVRRDLIPMGAAKYAQWALSDILEFEEFNPTLKRHTNRKGEDHLEDTPYQTDGKAPFPYESTLTEHDLHLMNAAGSRQNYNKRMQHKYRFDFGIPGLTDGYNAVIKPYGPELIGTIPKPISSGADINSVVKSLKGKVLTFRLLNTNVEKGSVVVGTDVEVSEAGVISGGVKAAVGTQLEGGKFEIVYVNELQGIIQIKVLQDVVEDYPVIVAYQKRGEAGVPTVLDWDGCVGTVKVLLQK